MALSAIIFWILSLISLAVLLSSRYIVGFWDQLMWIPLASFFVFLLLAVFSSKSGLHRFLMARTTKAGMNFLTASLLCLGFLIGINFLTVKYNIVWDLSEDKKFSLHTQTKQVLDHLKDDYEIHAFYTAEDKNRKESAYHVLRLIESYSSKVGVNFKDPNLYPDLVERYSIRASGTIVITSGDRQTRVIDSTDPKVKSQTGIKEENLVNAIIQLDRKKDITLCFSQGHNEKDLNDTSALGASDFKSSLIDLSYKISMLRLFEVSSVPSMCNVLLILGPEYAFEEKELDLIYRYLDKGGRLFLAIDPGKSHNLSRVSKYVGLGFTNLFLVDMEGQIAGQNAALTVGRDYNADHPITKNFNNSMYSFFPVSSYFRIVDQEKWQVSPLIYSSEKSFSRQSLNQKQIQPGANENTGPFPISAVSKKGKAMVVSFADSDFLLNQFYLKIINSDIALNTISYLSGEEKHISVKRQRASQDVLVLTETKKKIYIILFVFLPVFFFILAFLLYWRTKNEK